MPPKQRYSIQAILVHMLALLALIWMLAEFLIHLDSYTANRALMLRSGSVGMFCLVASFACTPLNRWWPRSRALLVRRALGLYGFLFVVIHLLVYAWLDNDFDLELMLRDLGERRAMSVGLLAFILLIPLAATSTHGWQRRLGKGWRSLHRLIYLALPLSVLHYWWLERDFVRAAVAYAVVVGVLWLARLDALRRSRLRRDNYAVTPES